MSYTTREKLLRSAYRRLHGRYPTPKQLVKLKEDLRAQQRDRARLRTEHVALSIKAHAAQIVDNILQHNSLLRLLKDRHRP